MLNIPERIKQLLRQDSVEKMLTVSFPNHEASDFTNEKVVDGTLKFTESICSRDTFKFGETAASRIEFECVGVPNILGATISVTISVKDSEDTYFDIPLGIFVVESCPRSKGSMNHRRVVAYSPDLFDQEEINQWLYEPKPFQSFTMTTAALLGWINPSTLTETEATIATAGLGRATSDYGYYNASGVQLGLRANTGQQYQITGLAGYDFFQIEYSADESKLEAYGKAIAKALDDAHIDIRYNSKKVKIYNTNEEALRAKSPQLFSIAIKHTFHTKYDTMDKAGSTDYHPNIRSGVLTPIIAHRGTGFGTTSPEWERDFYTVRALDSPAEFSFQLLKESDSSVVFEQTLTGLESWNYTFETPKLYKCPVEDLKITIGKTLTISNKFHQTNLADERKFYPDKNLTGYAYSNAFSFEQALDGILELTGRFGRHGRDGGLEIISLSDSDPVTLSPSEYEDCWFDEYDIAPIGTVKYSFGNPEATVEYEFGEGQSVYDMTGNYFLSKLKYTALDVSDDTTKASKQAKQIKKAIEIINGILDQYFIPAVEDIIFTPVDLQAIGLPYVQPGDFYEINTPDGATIRTYMLSRTLEGVNRLTDDIQSQGGEIIAEGLRSL